MKRKILLGLVCILILLSMGEDERMTTLLVDGWIYPGAPACSALNEIADGRTINAIKPEFFTLQDNGVLSSITADTICNGYSSQNVTAIQAHSAQQFVTVSGSMAGLLRVATNSALLSTCMETMNTFLQTTHFAGVEIDIENFGSWTQEQYRAYKNVITLLGTALHHIGKQLLLDGPAISTPVEQGYYQWRYEDFATLPVDSFVVMAYDNQYDTGAGNPVQPLAWLRGICAWMKQKVALEKIVIGIPSYGYHGHVGEYQVTKDTYAQTREYPGFATATRDPQSGEMMWTNNGILYNYSDTETLATKIQTVIDAGIFHVSLWHLGGGNAWPNQQPIIPLTADTTLQLFHATYPGFDGWYAQHFDENGKYTA